MGNKLATKVNSIDTSEFASKTKYNTDKSDLGKKIPNTSGFAKKADLSDKKSEIKGKILSITGLATNAALPAVENKTPNIGDLVEKTDCIANISEIEKKVSD